MSLPFQNALSKYEAGAYGEALAALRPLLAPRPPRELPVLMLAAQCHARTRNFAEASAYYAAASELPSPQQAVLRTLSANMARLANDPAIALQKAREAARSGVFHVNAEETYRRFLHEALVFDEIEREDRAFFDRMRAGEEQLTEVDFLLNHISWCDDEALNARQRRMHDANPFTLETRAARRAMPHSYGKKIRTGYLSADVSDNAPMMRLIHGMLLSHDPERFEFVLFCNTDAQTIAQDSGGRATYPNLVPISGLDDATAARLIRSHGIDILVDLMGHTRNARIALINGGLAPVQVAYLGFPGSGNGIDCDYVIGDRFVLPDSSKPHYHEKFVRLPDSYQANDAITRPLPPPVARAALGLPDNRFVFASFNGLRKITPQTARIWAKVLKAVPESLFWVMCLEPHARENFSRWMVGEGIAAERILFAPAAAYGDHIARLAAADLALDSFPYNGHTTTSDKLWAGLPVITIRGRHFASRVSESLLNAVGLSELVADDEDGYVRLATALAGDPQRIATLKDHLVSQRLRLPLFDTLRFTRHMEAAFTAMVERARAGLAPDHMDIPRMPL